MKNVFLSRVLMGLMMLFALSCDNHDDDNTPPDNSDSEKPQIELNNSGKVDGYEFVDLGLNVNWATCNMGANYPENYGNYYAWGEIIKKEYYNLNNYLLYQDGSYLNIGKDISKTTHDAAYISWGKKWRMPTYDDFNELENRCTFQWVNYNNTEGCLVQGPNGNKMFLPAAGEFDNYLAWDKSLVLLWGSTLWPWGNHHDLTQCESAVAISIMKRNILEPSYVNLSRCTGCPIRPVTTATPDVSNNDDNNGDNPNGNGGEENDKPYVIRCDFTATKTSITVKFMCNIRPTKATIKYGTSSPSKTVSTTITNKQVSATVRGLNSGTKYYFNCTVSNSYGSSTSDTYPAMTNY